MILSELLLRVIFQLLNGIIWGLIICLIALGLSLIFGIMNIVNMAHGEFYMLGAVLLWYFIKWGVSFWPSVVLAALIIGIMSMGLERGVIRIFEGDITATVIVTIALSYIFQQTVLATFGGWPQTISDPLHISVYVVLFNYPAYRLVVCGVSILALVAVWMLLYKTSLGIKIRAAMEDKEMAEAMGVSVSRLCYITFAIGAALCALAGALSAPIVQIFYLMGLEILCLAFIVVIVGGLGSFRGTFVASLVVCCLEGVMNVFVTPTEARVISFLFMAAVLIIRPQGLFR